MDIDSALFFIYFAIGVGYGYMEHTKLWNTPMSKYRSSWLQEKTGTIDARKGFVLLYSMSIPAVLGGLLIFGFDARGSRALLGTATFLLHFVKRMCECACVHVYSAPMDAFTVIYLGSCYLVIGSVFAFDLSTAGTPFLPFASTLMWTGLVCWVIGEVLNGWHHWILATLRTRPSKHLKEPLMTGSANSSKEYVLPTGGLFTFVLYPHFLGEMFSFVGMALIINRGAVWGIVCFSNIMQCGRASAGRQWYEEKFGVDKIAPYRTLFPFVW